MAGTSPAMTARGVFKLGAHGQGHVSAASKAQLTANSGNQKDKIDERAAVHIHPRAPSRRRATYPPHELASAGCSFAMQAEATPPARARKKMATQSLSFIGRPPSRPLRSGAPQVWRWAEDEPIPAVRMWRFSRRVRAAREKLTVCREASDGLSANLRDHLYSQFKFDIEN